MIDFPPIIGMLHDIGYDGFVSAELLANPDGDSAARQTLAYLRPLLEKRR
jgi:sugar phosphate isomerase/epimerase